MVFIPLNHIQPILHHNAMLYLVSDTSALIGIWRTCSVVKFQFSVVYDDVFSVFPIVGMGKFSPSLSILGLVFLVSGFFCCCFVFGWFFFFFAFESRYSFDYVAPPSCCLFTHCL